MATSPTSPRNPPPAIRRPTIRHASRRRRANLNDLLCFRPRKGLRKHSKPSEIRNEPSTRRSTEAPRNKTAGKQAASKRDQPRIRDSKTVNRQFFQKDSNPSKIDRRQPSTHGQEPLRRLEAHRGHGGNRPRGRLQAHLQRDGPRLHRPQGADGPRTCPRRSHAPFRAIAHRRRPPHGQKRHRHLRLRHLARRTHFSPYGPTDKGRQGTRVETMF